VLSRQSFRQACCAAPYGRAIERLEPRRLLTAAPVRLGPEVVVSAPADLQPARPAVAADGAGGFVVARQVAGRDGDGLGVYVRRYDAAGAPAGEEFRANATTTSNQSRPAVAAAAGGFVIVWQSDQGGSGPDLFGQLYDASGAPRGGEFAVNAALEGPQATPAVAMAADGRFVVAWADLDNDQTAWDIGARLFAADGSPAGLEFVVNTVEESNQNGPAVGMAADGAFVIAWDGSVNEGSTFGLFARRFGADGTPRGDEFAVIPELAANLRDPTLAVEPDGGFVAAWQAPGGEAAAAGYDVYARRFAADGAPRGGAFPVNTHSAGDQTAPAASAGQGGGFVVAWQSDGQDGAGLGVYARAFDAGGVPITGELPVNTRTEGDQSAAAVAAGPGGAFLAAWQSAGPNGAGVHAQRFGPPGGGSAVVTGVFVSGAAWTSAFKKRLSPLDPDAERFGYPVRRDVADATLPWTNLGRLILRFAANAPVRKEDLVVRGQAVARYAIADFVYDSANVAATWTMARSLRSDRVELRFAGSVFRIDVVAGDVTRDGVVNVQDVTEVRTRQCAATAASAAYSVFHDLDGSGAINVLDYAAARARQGAALPAVPAAMLSAAGRARPPVRRQLFGETPVLV
jgi:hypothetical protein